MRESVITSHWNTDAEVSWHSWLACLAIHHIHIEGRFQYNLVDAFARCLEILVRIMWKLMRCVQVERVVALFFSNLLAAIVKSRLLRCRAALEEGLMQTVWHHSAHLTAVLQDWFQVVASTNLLHPLQGELEVPTCHQCAHILQPNWRLMHTLLIRYASSGFQQGIETLNLLIFLIQLRWMLISFLLELIFEFQNLLFELIRFLAVVLPLLFKWGLECLRSLLQLLLQRCYLPCFLLGVSYVEVLAVLVLNDLFLLTLYRFLLWLDLTLQVLVFVDKPLCLKTRPLADMVNVASCPSDSSQVKARVEVQGVLHLLQALVLLLYGMGHFIQLLFHLLNLHLIGLDLLLKLLNSTERSLFLLLLQLILLLKEVDLLLLTIFLLDDFFVDTLQLLAFILCLLLDLPQSLLQFSNFSVFGCYAQLHFTRCCSLWNLILHSFYLVLQISFIQLQILCSSFCFNFLLFHL